MSNVQYHPAPLKIERGNTVEVPTQSITGVIHNYMVKDINDIVYRLSNLLPIFQTLDIVIFGFTIFLL